MSSPLLLEGQIDNRDEIIRQSQETIRQLRIQVRQLEEALRDERIRVQAIESGVRELKHLLNPLYRSFQKMWGEFDEMGITESTGSAGVPQFDPKWEAWKSKLGAGTAPARIIDALLQHGPLNRTQLRQAGELGWSTLDAATSRLKNLSLIEKISDRWHLKS